MQASDIILGLLIILLVGWNVMLAVQQNVLSSNITALEAKKVAQGIQISPGKCPEMSGYVLATGTELSEKEYLTTVGFDPDRNQAYFCFYQ